MKIINKIILVSVFILSVAGLAEITLRLVRYPSLQYFRDLKIIHKYHPDYNVGLAENADVYLKHNLGFWEGRFTTNSFGHRGSPEPSEDKPALVCLGDSVVMGFGVSDDETFCSRLNGVSGYPAINLGVDAFGSLGTARRLKEASEQFPIGLALFFVSPNDFMMAPDLRARGILSDDEQDDFRLNDPFFKRSFQIQFELTRWSYLLMASRLAIEQLKIKKVQTQEDIKNEIILIISDPYDYFLKSFYNGPHTQYRSVTEKKESAPGITGSPGEDAQVMCPVPIPSGYSCAEKEPDPETLPELLPATKAAYDQMFENAKAKGFPLVLVILPIQLNDIHCLSHGKHSEQMEYAIRSALYFKKHKMPVMDLRPYVKDMCGRPFTRESDRKKSRYGYTSPDDHIIPADGHFTYEGNLWASQAILDFMKKNGGKF
jgi:hypothetical protein